MKTAFICSSLELGRDGVGDYTRRLAAELLAGNNEVLVIALNDRHITEIFTGTQYVDGFNIPVVRIPAKFNNVSKFALLKQHLDEFKADLISIQYVNFGYNKYGLPFNLILKLKGAINGVSLQIMFHELWCGMDKSASLKEKALGLLQKVTIKLTIVTLKPKFINTNISRYQRKLKQLNVESTLLPIFSNISTTDRLTSIEQEKFYETKGLTDVFKQREDKLTLGFFGSVYHYAALENLVAHANEAAKSANKKLTVICIGHNRGADVAKIIEKFSGATIFKVGMLSVAEINAVAKLIDLGVVTSPADCIDKSGSAIMWLERSIPIVIADSDTSYDEATMKIQGINQVSNKTDVINIINKKTEYVAVEQRLKDTALFYQRLI